MGVKLNFFNVFLVILFVTGIVVSGFLLYNLPATLLKETLVLDIDEVKSLGPVLFKVNIAVGATLMTGLAAIIVLLFSKGNNSAIKQEATASNKQNEAKEGAAVNQDDFNDEEENNIDVREYQKLFAEKLPLEELSTQLLTRLCSQIEASQAALYYTNKTKNQRLLELKGSYAYILADSEVLSYEFGEGLVGQVAKTGKTAHVKEVPQGYIEIFSGLGHSEPGELLIIPIKDDKEVLAVAEIATFRPFSKSDVKIAEKSFKLLGDHLVKAKPSKVAEKEDKKSEK